MKQEHLTENELQQFVLEPLEAGPQQAAHVAECTKCAAVVANYRLMFTALNTMEKPAFNFDLEKQIMAALSVSPTRKNGFPWFAIGISAVSAAMVAIPLYIMRNYFTHMFTSIPAPVVYLVAATTLTIIIFQCRELFSSYRQKTRLLNYY
ncbi:MAG TPA: hypothetical protein VIM79_25135 [Niastella sp.]